MTDENEPPAAGRLPAVDLAGLPLIHRGQECGHLRALGAVAEPRTEYCEECGARRMLRVCLACGHVGCCDSAHGHAREHARRTGHQLIRAWRGGAFVYCYEHRYL
jgi:CPA1 family monovalent cation:H+ antiporter